MNFAKGSLVKNIKEGPPATSLQSFFSGLPSKKITKKTDAAAALPQNEGIIIPKNFAEIGLS